MKANDSKPSVSYLNKLLEEYSNSFHRSTGKKPIDNGYSALKEKIQLSHKALKFDACERFKTTD